MMWPWFQWGFGGWIMGLGMVIFWGLIIWGIVALVRWGRHGYHTTNSTSTESAMEILKIRYARGEISKEEFEEKKQAIS